MNQEAQYTDEIEIDLKEIFLVLWRKLGIIVLAGALLALVAMIGTQLFIAPTYVSTTKMYVLNRQNGDTLTSSDIQMSNYLTKDYADMIKSRTVTESVIADLNLDMRHEELLAKVSVSTSSDTRIVGISVTDGDPYRAAQIANAIRDASAEHIKAVMAIEAVNIVDEANIPDQKAGPSVMKNGFVAGVLGCFVAAAIIIGLYLLNDTIKTSDDIERYLGLSTLGSIPLTEHSKKTKKRKIKAQSKSGNKSRRGR